MEYSPEEAMKTRLMDFEAWLNGFAALPSFKDKIKPISNAGALLNQFYWNVVQAYVRPLLGESGKEEDKTHHLINRFKIISITELTIMAVLPFDVVDHEKGLLDEEVNARFAWYCAITILTGWNGNIDKKALDTIIEYKEILNPGEAVEMRAEFNFRKEHIQLMTTLDTRVQLPVLSNAQTWRLFYFSVLAVNQKLS